MITIATIPSHGTDDGGDMAPVAKGFVWLVAQQVAYKSGPSWELAGIFTTPGKGITACKNADYSYGKVPLDFEFSQETCNTIEKIVPNTQPGKFNYAKR